MDVDPAASRRAPDFEVYVGSQDDAALLDRVVDDHPDLEVVIDDASHINPLTFASFDRLFRRLPSGGLYAIEDLAPPGYGRDWPGADAHSDGTWGRTWPGMEHGPEVSLLDNKRADLDAFRAGLAISPRGTRSCPALSRTSINGPVCWSWADSRRRRG